MKLDTGIGTRRRAKENKEKYAYEKNTFDNKTIHGCVNE